MNERARESRAIWEEAFKNNVPIREEEQALVNREGILLVMRLQHIPNAQERLPLDQVLTLYKEATKTDERNVLAYYDLARNYLTTDKDLDQAEYYCQKGYAVQDIPPEITKAPGWLADIREEVKADFDYLTMRIRLEQGKIDEARSLLNNLETYFEKYSKGHYAGARELFARYERTKPEPAARTQGGNRQQEQMSTKGGCASVLVALCALFLLLIFVLR